MHLLCRALAAAAFAVTFTAAAAEEATPQSPAPADNAAYFVIGIAPEGVDVVIEPGTINAKDGDFDRSGTASTPVTRQLGYIVGRLDADTYLAITHISAETRRAYGTGLIGLLAHSVLKDHGVTEREDLTPCAGQRKTLAFQAMAGHVLYFGDVTYTVQDNGYWGQTKGGFDTQIDLEKARAFLKEHDPELAGRVELGRFDMRHVSYGC